MRCAAWLRAAMLSVLCALAGCGVSAPAAVAPSGSAVKTTSSFASQDAEATWIDSIRYGDSAAFYAACKAAARADGAQLAALIDLLDSEDSTDRRNAMFALQHAGARGIAALSRLVALLHDQSLSVRIGATHALASMGPVAESALPALEALAERLALRIQETGSGRHAWDEGMALAAIEHALAAVRREPSWLWSAGEATGGAQLWLYDACSREADHRARARAALCKLPSSVRMQYVLRGHVYLRRLEGLLGEPAYQSERVLSLSSALDTGGLSILERALKPDAPEAIRRTALILAASLDFDRESLRGNLTCLARSGSPEDVSRALGVLAQLEPDPAVLDLVLARLEEPGGLDTVEHALWKLGPRARAALPALARCAHELQPMERRSVDVLQYWVRGGMAGLHRALDDPRLNWAAYNHARRLATSRRERLDLARAATVARDDHIRGRGIDDLLESGPEGVAAAQEAMRADPTLVPVVLREAAEHVTTYEIPMNQVEPVNMKLADLSLLQGLFEAHLHGDDPTVRLRACTALRACGAEAVVRNLDRLLWLIRTNTESAGRAVLLLGFLERPSPEVVHVLVKVACGRDYPQRDCLPTALEALVRLGRPGWAAAPSLIAEMKARCVRLEKAFYYDKSIDPLVEALAQMVEQGGSVARQVLAALPGTPPDARGRLLSVLARAPKKTQEIQMVLLDGLAHGAKDVRESVAWALGRRVMQEAWLHGPLRARASRPGPARAAAALTMQAPVFVPALRACLRDGDVQTRIAALKSLDDIDGFPIRRAVPEIRALRDDPDEDVRRLATSLLEQIVR